MSQERDLPGKFVKAALVGTALGTFIAVSMPVSAQGDLSVSSEEQQTNSVVQNQTQNSADQVPKDRVPAPENDAQHTLSEKPQPGWKTSLPAGNESLPKLIEAISGKKNSDETVELLKGVVKVSKVDDSFVFVREDEQELQFGRGTAIGDRMLDSLEKTRRDTERYNTRLSEVMSCLRAVSITGNHIELHRDGPEELRIQVSAGKKKIPVKLKEVRLAQLSMDLDESKGFPSIRNINGLEVIVAAGIDWHIVLKEFWRTKNERGDTTVTFGIINPLPGAVRFALGLKEITYFNHTIRKKTA